MSEIKYIDWNSEKENLEKMINKDKLTLNEISNHYHIGITQLKIIIKELKINRTSNPDITVRRKYSDKSIVEAVKNNVSIAGTLRTLGLRDIGGNYTYIHKRIDELKLDTSHFTGQLWGKGKTKDKDGINNSSVSLEDIFANKVKIRSNSLKERLIKAGLKERKCECCKNTEWNGKPIPTELHHIDGNHNNNSLDNLQILCPNCHAQTNTYCGRGISKLNYEIPKKEDLLSKLRESGSVKNLAKSYSVSETTIREWVKKNNMREEWEKTLKEIKKP